MLQTVPPSGRIGLTPIASSTLPRTKRRNETTTRPRQIKDRDSPMTNSGRSFIRTCLKAKRVRFFRNGDQYFAGMWYAVTAERFRNMTSLLDHLTKSIGDLINLPHGVRLLFTVDGIQKIEHLDQLEDGESYVCASNDSFKHLDYQNVRQPVWKYATNVKWETLQENRCISLHINVCQPEKNDFVRPRIITVIRKGVRPRRVVRLLLNKRSAQSFHQVLCDITAAIKLDSGSLKRLFTLDGHPVTGLIDFFGRSDVFIGSGSERLSIDDFYLDSEEFKLLSSIRGNAEVPSFPNDATPKLACRVPPLLRNDLNSSLPSPASRRRLLPKRNQTKLKSTKRTKHLIDQIEEDSDSNSGPSNSGDTPREDVRRGLCALGNSPRHPSEIESKIAVGRFLGDGCFASVYESRYKESGEMIALKVIDKAKCAGKEELVDNEVAILQRCVHENIVLLHDVWEFSDSFYMAMELIEGGDLFDWLTQAGRMSELDSSHLLTDLCSALDYLHNNNIVHRDVKPENLLLFESEGGRKRLKLADFGLACEIAREPLLTVCGTPTYVAPEILCENGYGVKVDVWASGVILYIMLCGFPPFTSSQQNQEELFDAILVGELKFPSPFFDKISPAAKGLIQVMLEMEYENRYSAAEVLAHPWVTGEAQSDPAELDALQSPDDLGFNTEIVNSRFTGSFWDQESVEFFYSRRRSMDELSTSHSQNDLQTSSNSPA